MTSGARRASFNELLRTQFDLLIIGGGITGAGIARDAALRGLKVALVDKADFAAGTSSKSSKLIHGGLRYLQHGELGLVFEAVSERTRLLKLAPHLVRPQLFLVPSYRGVYPGRMALNAGLWLYDALSKFQAPARHRGYGPKALLTMEPGLRSERLTGGVVYYDSMTDDARLTLENVLDARQNGAVVLSYARVTGFLTGKDGNGPGGNGSNGSNGHGSNGNGAPVSVIQGAEVQDVLDPGVTVKVRAKVTVNATGPWSDLVLRLNRRDQPPPLLRPTKGSHIVLDAARLPVKHAVVMQAPQDQRVVFVIPWLDPEQPAASRVVVGTTDTDYHGDPDDVTTDAEDVDYLLACVNHFFPASQLVPADVLATWAGLRPLVAPEAEGVAASSVSREHRILSQPGLVTIVGGKLTTYRRMAAQLLHVAYEQLGVSEPPCATDERPLPGAADLPAGERELDPLVSVVLALRGAGVAAIDGQVAQHLAHQYGVRALRLCERLQQEEAAPRPSGDGVPAAGDRLDPELPYLYAEVDLAVEEDEAQRLEDVLARRMPLLLKARDQGLGCAEAVAARMARTLGWTPEQTAAEVEAYRAVVAESRQFRRDARAG
ncbi:MAG: glycerol-3-phosphate dehydrogenase/oxidase [Polyangia bacterium]